jgi:hypothetical protein
MAARVDSTRKGMLTYPIRCESGHVIALEVRAQLFGCRLAKGLRTVPRVSDVRPRRWWRGSSDVHIRFRYEGSECIVWEPYGDNSRWWIGPDEGAPPVQLDELERAIARL